MKIGLAKADDLPAILAIANHYALTTAANFAIEPESLESWRNSYDETHEMFPWLVAIEISGGDETVIGIAKASPWKGRCAYAHSAETTIYVHQDHHRRGAGRALNGSLLKTMTDQGYRSVIAGTALPNPGAIALHEAFGFERVALLKRIGWKFDRWHDVGYWQKQLRTDSSPPTAVRPVVEVFRIG